MFFVNRLRLEDVVDTCRVERKGVVVVRERAVELRGYCKRDRLQALVDEVMPEPLDEYAVLLAEDERVFAGRVGVAAGR